MDDLTWVVKIDQEPGGSRWRVNLWLKDPPLPPGVEVWTEANPYRIVFKWERDARDWAERVATSFEMTGDPWEVAEDSM